VVHSRNLAITNRSRVRDINNTIQQ